MTAPGISVADAGLAFGGKTVFSDLTVEVAAGRWTALLGPSGVGKSSLLRLIAALPAVDGSTRGTVTASDGAPLDGRIAYMAQRDLLLPWLSVLDNVLIGVRLRGGRPDAAARGRATALLDDLGLSGEASARPDALSGGMRQRVALARALFEDRPVVLMDEPFSALDALTRHRLQETAARMLRGRTVVQVTHDPMEALRLADRVLVLAGAPPRISALDPPDGIAPREVDQPGMAAASADLIRRLSGKAPDMEAAA
jgi:putative hydroxymethylpyrimidine transport system ATP-binding protein